MRFDRRRLDALDAWIDTQHDPKPSRPEAIRRIVDSALRFNLTEIENDK